MVDDRYEIIDPARGPVVESELAVLRGCNLPECARIHFLYAGEMVLQKPVARRFIEFLIQHPRQIKQKRASQNQRKKINVERSVQQQVSKDDPCDGEHTSPVRKHSKR